MIGGDTVCSSLLVRPAFVPSPMTAPYCIVRARGHESVDTSWTQSRLVHWYIAGAGHLRPTARRSTPDRGRLSSGSGQSRRRHVRPASGRGASRGRRGGLVAEAVSLPWRHPSVRRDVGGIRLRRSRRRRASGRGSAPGLGCLAWVGDSRGSRRPRPRPPTPRNATMVAVIRSQPPQLQSSMCQPMCVTSLSWCRRHVHRRLSGLRADRAEGPGPLGGAPAGGLDRSRGR